MSVERLRNGRNGLGQIIVFSAGNDSNNANVSLTTNKNYPGYFAIASLWRNTGEVTDFSTVGENLTGAATGNGGTSYAAPHAAGIFALMLEANPGLGFRDVQDIVAYSSRYLSTPTPTARFSVNGANTLNGAGPHFSHLAGFGAINAYNATRLAIDWHKAGYTPSTAANWTQKISEDTSSPFSYNTRSLADRLIRLRESPSLSVSALSKARTPKFTIRFGVITAQPTEAMPMSNPKIRCSDEFIEFIFTLFNLKNI